MFFSPRVECMHCAKRLTESEKKNENKKKKENERRAKGLKSKRPTFECSWSSPWLRTLTAMNVWAVSQGSVVALLTDMASAAPRDTSRQIDALFFRAATNPSSRRPEFQCGAVKQRNLLGRELQRTICYKRSVRLFSISLSFLLPSFPTCCLPTIVPIFVLRCIALTQSVLFLAYLGDCREPAPRLCPRPHYSLRTTSHHTSHDLSPHFARLLSPSRNPAAASHVCFFTSRPVAVIQTFIYIDTSESHLLHHGSADKD